MKKLLTILTALVAGVALVGCKKEKENPEEPVEPTPVVEKAKYVGLGYDAAFADGTATVTGAVVSFKEDGTIVATRIDVVQVKVEAGETPNVIKLQDSCKTWDEANGSYVKTKLELGKDYNMKAYGSSKLEVDGNIESYAKWTVGKKATDVAAALKARTDGHYEGAVYTSDDALWAAGVTITVNGFASAVKDAWDHKVEGTVDLDAKAGISLIGTLSEATHGAGYDQVTVDMGGAFVKGGKIQAALIDAITFSFKADETAGFVENRTTKYYDAQGKSLSKKVLGDAYAMADRNHPAYSNGCTLEWYEQAANIEKFAAGKTAEEIGAATEITGATITISAYTRALSNAAKYATMEHVGPQA